MINVSDASFIFGNKVLVVNLTVIPAGKLQCRTHIINYHRTREAQAKFVIKFVHMNVNDNPAYIGTKIYISNTWLPLIKTLLLWRDMGFLKEQVVSKGSENSLSTPPLSQDKGTTQK